MRVAQISTWQTACGIAGYTAALRTALLAAGVSCTVVPIDRTRLRYLPLGELKRVVHGLGEQASAADVVHIQHDFAFFAGAYGWRTSIDLFQKLVRQVRARGSAVAVTFHTEPVFRAHDRAGAAQMAREAALRALWSTMVGRRFATDPQIAGVVHTRSSRLALVRSGLPASRIHVLRQGTPPPSSLRVTSEERARMKEALGFPMDARVLSIFGFISKYKGYATAIRALSRLPTEYNLVIIGSVHPFSDENALDEILGMVRRRRLSDRVRVTGYLPAARINEYLAISDICLAPYRPLPRLSSSAALTWALAAGRPIIASRVPAFLELNEDYDCLDLIAPNAPNELAFRAMALDHDPDRVATLAANAQRYCEDNQWSRVGTQHISLYNRLLGNPVALPVGDSAAERSAVAN